MEMLEKFAPLFVTVLFGAFGLWVWYTTWRGYHKVVASLSWPTVQGVINESAVIERQERFEATHDPARGDEYYTVRIARIVYSYTVNNQEYKASNFSNTLDGKEQLVAKYPKGKTVRVSYNPQDPQECMVEPIAQGNSRFVLTGIVIGLILFAIAALPVLYVFAPTQTQAVADSIVKVMQDVVGYRRR
jgi:multisubunit Na+/H+ antiporter MnhC subunit